ncbi:MAG: 2-oxo-4-hydroxy-4-carboxy-5-ureidoimidazoline decarboxylase [Gemmatimonadota bacterium]|nr:2-oxo-4-hydroxy-4-carboxy-5-ureidoimidazoline decarboxylase [Gemmatimonadota bacterium]
MSITVADLDGIPGRTAASLLLNCCGSSRWVSEMVAARPFGSRDALLSEADRIWTSLNASDWLEAFAHHPRIGERTAALSHGEQGDEWADEEQAGVADADDEARSALTTANQEYERRFGYIYIVCATGKTPDEMLELARQRLRNDGATELRVAAEEQRKITRIRLEKLLEEEK